MKLTDILRDKSKRLHTIWPDATLQDVVDLLVQYNCGSLLVLDGEQLRGIITERDILRATAMLGEQSRRLADGEPHPQLADLRVADQMSVDLLTAQPDDLVAEAMGWMTEHRVRHLPVVEGERLVGIVSIGDIVKAQHHQLCVENHYLKNYIQS